MKHLSNDVTEFTGGAIWRLEYTKKAAGQNYARNFTVNILASTIERAIGVLRRHDDDETIKLIVIRKITGDQQILVDTENIRIEEINV